MKTNTALQLLDQREVLGKDFKVYGTWEEPLFLAKDVATWIENKQPTQMVESVDESEKLKCLQNTSGQNRQMWFLTEEGVYEVLFQSKKPIAKQFKSQVKAILKDIRKQGYYMTPAILQDPDFVIQLGMQMKQMAEEKNQLTGQVAVLEKELDFTSSELDYMENVIAEYEPKVDYYEKILTSDCLMTATQIAADYGISARRLNQILHEAKVHRKVNGQWVLYAKYVDRDYTKSDTVIPQGKTRPVVQTKWTQRGRLLIHEILETKGIDAA